MRPGGFSIAVTLALVAATSALAVADVSIDVATDPRVVRSIRVDGDEGWAGIDPAILSGSGTASDPFVLERLLVLPDTGPGIDLRGTSKHVLIRDVRIEGYTRDVLSGLSASFGIRLVGASNVTIERLKMTEASYGVWIESSEDVLVRESDLRMTLGQVGGFTDGIAILSSRTVRVENVHVRDAIRAITVQNSVDVDIEGSTFHSTEFLQLAPLQIIGSERLTFRNNFVENGGLGFFVKASRDIAVIDNEFLGGFGALDAFDAGIERLDFCGNTIRGVSSEDRAVRVRLSSDLTFRSNTFEENHHGLHVQESAAVAVVGNVFRDQSDFGLIVEVPGAEIQGNSFAGNGRGVSILETSNATLNWWGSDDGPSGVGAGSGDRLVTAGAAVAFAPWLVESPPAPSSCDADPRQPATELTTPIAVSAQASVRVHATGTRLKLEAEAPGVVTLP